MEQRLCLGIIAGSGLSSALDGIYGIAVDGEQDVITPYGRPSDRIVRARTTAASGIATMDLLFLPRHGRGHRIPPHRINYRANICALKMLGVTHVLAISAVGSLRERIAPGHLVAVNQLIDWTRRRETTFFDDIAVHVALSDPICPVLYSALASAACDVSGATAHAGGTLIVIDGPQFSTHAESELYRGWGADLVGMTALPEAKLAREAELPYALLALATDYDCWHPNHAAVTGDMVTAVMRENAGAARRVIREFAKVLPNLTQSPAFRCLDGAIVSDPTALPEGVRAQLSWLRPFAARASVDGR